MIAAWVYLIGLAVSMDPFYRLALRWKEIDRDKWGDCFLAAGLAMFAAVCWPMVLFLALLVVIPRKKQK